MSKILSERENETQADLLRRFVFWSLRMLDLPTKLQPGGVYRVDLPEDSPVDFHGSDRIEFSFDASRENGVETPGVDSRLLGWLLERLAADGEPLHAAPAAQPRSVHEVSPYLFLAYRFQQGNIHLGGCRLEDQPVIRVTLVEPDSERGEEAHRMRHLFMTTAGKPLDEALIRSLGLSDLVPYPGNPPSDARREFDRWLETARRAPTSLGLTSDARAVLVTVVWCKFVEGTLVFSTEQRRLEVSFSGLAQLYVGGELVPPPAVCEATGESSHELVVADDGRITVDRVVRTCSVSGRRVAHTDLRRCEATDREALPEYLVTCPITGKQVLPEAMSACSMCGQEVVTDSLSGKRCPGCRALQTARKDDPRIARVLGEHPKLDKWRNWRIAEGASVYVLIAGAVVKRLLMVLDQETLEPIRLAMGSRFSRGWVPIPESQWSEYV